MLNAQATPDEFRDAAAPFLESHGFSAQAQLSVLRGGANNRVYLVTDQRRQAALKRYFRNPNDSRDRFRAEQAFYQFLWKQGIRRTPEPLGWDSEQRLGLFSFLTGQKLLPSQVSQAAVRQAGEFIVELNESATAAMDLPLASESCFSLSEHLQCVQRRVARLDHLEALTELDQEAATLVQNQLQPCWTQVSGAIAEAAGAGFERVLSPAERCVSPSDFGFHNALADSAGRLGFFDFEYAGWDDPAKLVCDFFCQPELPVAREHWDFFLQTVGRVLPGGSSLAARSQLLLPAYRIKWCCIMLNDFVGTDQARREFALGDLAAGERKRTQLEKTRKALAEVIRAK